MKRYVVFLAEMVFLAGLVLAGPRISALAQGACRRRMTRR